MSAGYAPRVEWTPSRIRLFREVGLSQSQPEFARTIGFAARTVGNAERSAHPPSLALRRALDHQLDAASGIQRDRFLAALRADAGSPRVPDPPVPVLESIELLRCTEASDLGPGTLSQLDELIERLGFEYFAVPPTEFRATVLAWRRYVARLLDGRATLAQRARLYAIAGWLSGLLAEVSLALGEEASPHCATALSLAREVGDAHLAGWVLGTSAQIALYTGDPRDSIAFARAGARLTPRKSAARFRAHAIEGRSHARAGDLAACESSFSTAERALSERTEANPGSFWSFDAPYLPYYAGTAYGWLDKPLFAYRRATEAMALCDAQPGHWPVARTSARIDLVAALIALNERGEAARIGIDAVEIWTERPTYPAKKRINDLMESVEPLRDSSSRTLVERWVWTSN